MANTILIINHSNSFFEADAAAAITPGHLVELDSSGDVQPHSTAKGNAAKQFAIEDALQGNGITDAYSADDVVRVWTPQPGDVVNALLSDGETAVIGTFLESNGDGTLQVYTDGVIIGQAISAVDMSGSSGADPSARILVRII